MIQGFGIDLTEIARVKRAVEKTPSFVSESLRRLNWNNW